MALTPSRPALIMIALVLAELTCSLESNMISVALSLLYRQYGDPVKVGWVMTAFLLAAAGTAAVGGRLGDIYGRRRVLLCMLGIALAGSTVSALSSRLEWLIVGRAMQGASMAILPLCFGLVREHWPARRLAFGVGLLGATYALGSGFGVMLGGVIVDRSHWQYIFVVSAALAAVAFVAVLAAVPTSKRAPRHGPLDVVGGLLFVPAVALLLLGLTRLRYWNEPATSLLIAAGAVLLAVWVRHELHHPDPLIDVRMLRNRQIALANLMITLTAFGPLMENIVMFPLMQQPAWTLVGLGASATLAGMVKIPSNIVSAGATTWAGHLCGRYGARDVVLAGAIISAIGWCLVTVWHGSFWFVSLLIELALSPGVTIVFSQVPNLILEAAPADRSSEATGLSQVIRSLGMAVGSQLVAVLLSSSMVTDPATGRAAYPSEAAYTLTLTVISGFSILAAIVAWMVPRRDAQTAALSAARTGGAAH